MVKRLHSLLAIAAAILIAFCSPAFAAVSPKDVIVLSKSLGFIQLADNATKLGIVYNAADPASTSAAQAAKTAIGDNIKAGAKSLAVVLVKVEELDQSPDLAALFVPTSLGTTSAKVLAFGKAHKAPCLTNDLDIVKNGQCAIAVTTDNAVVIYVSKAVTDDLGLFYDPAFKMLSKEI